MNDLYKTFASVLESRDWAEHANCKGMDTNLFFPKLGGQIDPFAREVCFTCDVQEECLWYANQTRSTDGMFGGLTPGQREIWRARNKVQLGQSKDDWENEYKGYLGTAPDRWSTL